ncbi:MAG: hypothetical protein DDT31_01779 [Syntrophomonadaceae bacterium]|nr:hypothetical protein [Bacillota bacterium]
MISSIEDIKDKPNAEGTVGIISTWIIASLRQQQFFSLGELNCAIRLKLEEFNQKPFQKKPGSRQSAFLEEEKALLLPLPASSYELATWSMASVQYDYHIIAEKNHYSVPFEYIRHKVDVRMTSKVIEVFYHNHRIASHVRVRGQEGQVITVPDHMPEKHKQYLAVNAEYFKNWAISVGPNAIIVVKAILSAHKVEKQGYRSCTSLMKLADKYSLSRVEEACERALSYTPSPSFKSIQTILKTGQDKVHVRPVKRQVTKRNLDTETFGFVRGADYYGGKDND